MKQFLSKVRLFVIQTFHDLSEVWIGRSYDQALRERVVCAANSCMSARAAAARFEIGVATAQMGEALA